MSDRMELDLKLAAGEIGFFEYALAMTEYYTRVSLEATKVREGQSLGSPTADGNGSDDRDRPPVPVGTDSSGYRGPELPQRDDQPPDFVTRPDRPQVTPASGRSGSGPADGPSGSGTG